MLNQQSDDKIHLGSEAQTVATRRRWRIAWLLGLGVLVNYFDRVNLSVSHSALTQTFGVSDFTYGLLLGAYNWTYALCQLPIGVVLDRLGVRLVGRISTLVWAVASFAAGASPTLSSLFGARFLLGVGEAPTFPANAKAIGAWFPEHERSLATSLFDSAAKLGSALGVPAIGILLLHIGWRLSFAATGVVSLLYFVLFSVVYREPHEDAKISREELMLISTHAAGRTAADQRPFTLLELLSRRKVLGFAIGFGSYNYVFYLLLTWLPSYLSESLHIDLMHSFLFTGVPWFVAAAADIFIGGILVDTLVRRGWNANRVRMTVLVAGTAFGLGIVGAGWSHSTLEALVWITLSIGGLSAAAPVGWTIPSLIAPPGSVGRVGGILNFSNQLSGVAAPVITGLLVYKLHSFAAAFAVAGVYLVIGICAYLLMLRDVHPMELEKREA